MTLEKVLNLLNELGGSASIKQITELGKEKNIGDSVTHTVKVRDSLIRLKRLGCVKGEVISKNYLDEIWVVVRRPSPKELKTRKRVIL